MSTYSQSNHSVSEVAGRYYKNYQNSKKELYLYENKKFKELFEGKEATAMIKKWKDKDKGKWNIDGDTITLNYSRLFSKSSYKHIFRGKELESHFCVTTNSVECKTFIKE